MRRVFLGASLAMVMALGTGLSSTLRAGTVDGEPHRIPYRIAVAGIGIGDLDLILSREQDRYAVRADGDYRVLFWSGAIAGEAEGMVSPEGPRPERFRIASDGENGGETVIDFDPANGPSRWERIPPAPAEWSEDRLPLVQDHLRTALDPITAIASSALQAAGEGASGLCQRDLRIFTGFVVFELGFTGAARAEDGRVTCPVAYRPLSGHRAGSSSVERLSEPGAIEIAFEELKSGVWVPARIALPTRIGTLTVTRG
ncbi:MAG: hypothetical protein AAF577_05535 [Pseudomonadota bacterium]